MVWRWMVFQGSRFVGFEDLTEFEVLIRRRGDGREYFRVDSYQGAKNERSELASVPGFKKRGV